MKWLEMEGMCNKGNDIYKDKCKEKVIADGNML